MQYATAKIGAILVNINPSYRSHELQYVLNQAGIRFLFAVEQFRSSSYAEMVEEVRSECPALEQWIYFGTEGWQATLDQAERVSASELAGIQARAEEH